MGRRESSQKTDVRKWGGAGSRAFLFLVPRLLPLLPTYIFTVFLPFKWAGNGEICLSYSELSAALRFNFHII